MSQRATVVLSEQIDALPKFKTASGAVVEIDAPGYDLSEQWFHAFRVKVDGPYAETGPLPRTRAFQVGPVGTVEGFAQNVLGGEVVEQLSALGGTLVIARNPEDFGIAAWRGRWHDVFVWLNEPGITARQVLSMYDRLEFVDGPLGVLVQTGASPNETIYREEVIKSVPNVGPLEIIEASMAVDLVPNWSGAKVRSGEVWQLESTSGDGGTRRTFVHASFTAVTVLDAERVSNPDENRLRFLDELVSLTWTRS